MITKHPILRPLVFLLLIGSGYNFFVIAASAFTSQPRITLLLVMLVGAVMALLTEGETPLQANRLGDTALLVLEQLQLYLGLVLVFNFALMMGAPDTALVQNVKRSLPYSLVGQVLLLLYFIPRRWVLIGKQRSGATSSQ